ncbi:hypothetical protein N7516_008473 [Penicillium verrucosum]|uniref:uncharacterized protein n=1 Tax=Penicillium verrucosum TaxID=60171 RepID=UPI002544DCC3|nr:uncharacterized protein N7516_008473 [Penicillium verrucosum]KAJ5926700.1 hypothetical protein N7516_008473 [Penicillium verrucosum]
MNGFEQLVVELEGLGMISASPRSLNLNLRHALRDFAQSEGFEFQHDNVGNIYLTRPGTDPNLPSLGLAFAVDNPDGFVARRGAIKTFLSLQKQTTMPCGISLFGFSSLGGGDIGYQVWSGTATAQDALNHYPFSAVISIAKVSNVPTSYCGDLAAEHHMRVVLSSFGLEAVPINLNMQISTRAPGLLVHGPAAVTVASAFVLSYSEYVAGMFDNFD